MISAFSKEIVGSNKNIFFDNELVNLVDNEICILLTSSSSLTYKEIENLRKRVNILGISIYGIFYII